MKAILARFGIIIYAIVGFHIWLITVPFGFLFHVIASIVIAPLAWMLIGKCWYNYIEQTFGLTRVDYAMRDPNFYDFKNMLWYWGILHTISFNCKIKYDYNYIQRQLDEEKKEAQKWEQYFKDMNEHRKRLNALREEKLHAIYPDMNIDDIPFYIQQSLEDGGLIPKYQYVV